MQVTIDNLSGSGPVDYTTSIESGKSVLIRRKLNAPSECTFIFLAEAHGLALPQRYARVAVADDAGLLLFTGYVATTPATTLAGYGIAGNSYQALITALSDELLLDSVLSVKAGTALNQPAAQTLQVLSRLTGGSGITLSTGGSTAVVGRYEARAALKWSEGASAIAASARSAYRVVGGVTSLLPVGTVIHVLNEADGSLQLGQLKASAVKLLANDVTVCGEIEPAAYVTEIFPGDGVSKDFPLGSEPFEGRRREELWLVDLFQGASLNGQLWQWTDTGSRLSITSGGVTCSGGSGRDGETVLSAIHQLELGGSVLLEAGGVQIGGQGMLLGLYVGTVAAANCFIGFQVTQVNGTAQVAALVNGSIAGSSFQPAAGHIYTLRVRVYSPEMERVQQSYYYLDATGVNSYGGGVVAAPGHIVMELQDVTSGAPGLPFVLYDGTSISLPPACTIGLLDSGALNCSVKTFRCSQTSPLWVTLTPSGGSAGAQYLGAIASGGRCRISGGRLSFYNGTIPPAGSIISVTYRTRHRAVARRSTAPTSLQAGATQAAPATAMWVGTVREPAAWSSADCDNAATALLKSSAAASAALAGTYTGWNIEANGDIWPGDVLAISSLSAGINAAVVVREVDINMGTCSPQLVKYTIRFANDWAEELALKLSPSVPADAWLPVTPVNSPILLANMNAMKVVALTGSQIQIDAGIDPPSGGGFEVKRKDWSFGPGRDSDLVLRSPVRNFTIPRVAAMEQYFIRMYDGSTPPNYSQLSAAVYADVPLGGS